MNSQIVTVNLIPGLCTPAVVRVSQYDVGRPILFKVFDGTMPASFVSGTIATVVGTKPSGLGFSEVAAISGNTASLNSTLAMTQEAGMIQAEVRFSIQYGPDIGTANFILAVEPSPHPDGTTDGTQETMADLETRLQAEIDDLSDRIDDIEAGGSGLSQTEKQLILTLFSKAAYAEDDASTAYDALENLWTTTTRTITYNLSHVSSSNTTASIEQGQSYTTTLTAVSNYTLNTVTVLMGGVDITSTAYSSGTVSIPSVTGNIVITATAVLAAQSITATYTQSGTVYDTDSLDSLKADLVVTANYAGGTSETVPASDYTLSGTLAVGTSTITVSYAGLTDTFNAATTHQLEIGSKTFTTRSGSDTTNRVISVASGNIVTSQLTTGYQYDMKANFSNVSLNIAKCNDTANNSVGTSKLFTIPSGASVTTSVKFTSLTYSNSEILTKNMNIAVRDQSGTALFLPFGNAAYSTITVNTPVTNTFTAETDLDVWNITIWMESNSTYGIVAEFELEITVNGVRII